MGQLPNTGKKGKKFKFFWGGTTQSSALWLAGGVQISYLLHQAGPKSETNDNVQLPQEVTAAQRRRVDSCREEERMFVT